MMILILWARQPDWKVLKEFLGLFEVLMMQKGCFSVCHIPALKEIYSRALNKGGTFQSSARLNSPIHLGGDEWPRWHCRVLYASSSKDFSSKWSGCSGLRCSSECASDIFLWGWNLQSFSASKRNCALNSLLEIRIRPFIITSLGFRLVHHVQGLHSAARRVTWDPKPQQFDFLGDVTFFVSNDGDQRGIPIY